MLCSPSYSSIIQSSICTILTDYSHFIYLILAFTVFRILFMLKSGISNIPLSELLFLCTFIYYLNDVSLRLMYLLPFLVLSSLLTYLVLSQLLRKISRSIDGILLYVLIPFCIGMSSIIMGIYIIKGKDVLIDIIV